MIPPLHHPHESSSNPVREQLTHYEPRCLRTYTPTQAVLARSAGIYHWTPEGRRLYDFSSGVLVANLGHNPKTWMKRYTDYMGWSPAAWERKGEGDNGQAADFFPALPMTAYNAVTAVEIEASQRLTALLQGRPGGRRLEQVLWAASGSEAIQKALWAALARDPARDMILATRYGFHGKKGLAGAVTGCETDHDRDPRVRFLSFPMAECVDVSQRGQPFDPTAYRRELEALRYQFGRRLSVLITEPYLGGGGSFHPPKEYLQLLQTFCREHDLVFILDEVQSNFGRTGSLFAYETYGLEPDIVVLGKGLGNGVPVAAAVGRTDLFAALDYGEGSDTWSANPLCCAAVLATLDEFAARDVLAVCRRASAVIEEGLIRLKELPFVAQVRGEQGGMVWGVELREHAGRSAVEWANAAVLACYRGDGGDGIHLLGPLVKKVLRIAPPLIMTEPEASEAMALMYRLLAALQERSPQPARPAVVAAHGDLQLQGHVPSPAPASQAGQGIESLACLPGPERPEYRRGSSDESDKLGVTMEQPLEDTKSLRQIVQVVGLLEAIPPSTRQFTLRLRNEQPVPCVLVEGDINTLEALLGKEVFISGMGVWLPTGRLERVEVDRWRPGEEESEAWRWLPIPRFPSELPPEEPTPRPSSLAEIVGEWPGDETDEELLKALKEMD